MVKITLSRHELQDALSVPASIAARGSIEMTSCIHIQAHGDAAVFSATDFDMSARVEKQAMVEQDGAVLVSARKLASIVKTLPDAAVTVEGDDAAVHLRCGKSRFRIPSLDPEDFPRFPRVDSSASVKLARDEFAFGIDACAPFVVPDKKGASGSDAMRGVRIVADGSSVTAYATDTYRIIRSECRAMEAGGAFDVIAPVAFLVEVAATKVGPVELSYSENQIAAKCTDVEIVARRIEGSMPNMASFFALPSNASADVGRSEMAALTRRSMAVASKHPMTITIGAGEVSASVEGGDSGDFSDSIEADTKERCYVCLHPAYLLSALQAASSDKVRISLDNPLKPATVSGGGKTCVIMPVRKS